jgi:hypothetical protein
MRKFIFFFPVPRQPFPGVSLSAGWCTHKSFNASGDKSIEQAPGATKKQRHIFNQQLKS